MKRLAIVLCAIICIALAVVPCYAAPSSLPSGVEIGGTLSINATMALANGVSAQMDFINSSGYYPVGVYYAAFITARNLGGDQWMYRVYIMPKSAGLSHTAFETGWLQAGASLIITPSSTAYYYTDYNFSASGGMGLWSYGYANGGITLEATEQIVYCFKLASGQAYGLNTYFPYGYVDNVPAAKSWRNALRAFDGDLSEEAVANSYNTGFAEGESIGYNNGYTAGVDFANRGLQDQIEGSYNSGYSNGYDVGYNKGLAISGGGTKAWYLDVPKLINAIPEAARTIFRDSFNVELFGINVAGLLSSILVTVIVAFIVRKLVKK